MNATTSVSAPVAIKVFGPDLDKLRSLGIEIQAVAKTLPGFEDVKLDQQSAIPQLRIEADRDRAKAYGIAPGKLNDQLSSLIGGKTVAELREGQRRVNLVMRLPVEWRDSPDKIAELPIEMHDEGDGRHLQRIPLSLVADVREAQELVYHGILEMHAKTGETWASAPKGCLGIFPQYCACM